MKRREQQPAPPDASGGPGPEDTLAPSTVPAPPLSFPRLPHRRRHPARPFTMRRRRRSRGGPLVFAVALVVAFTLAAFGIGYVVGRMLL